MWAISLTTGFVDEMMQQWPFIAANMSFQLLLSYCQLSLMLDAYEDLENVIDFPVIFILLTASSKYHCSNKFQKDTSESLAC